MSDTNENKNLVPQDKIDGKVEWNGCTLEELKRRRVVALVRRELGREKLAYNVGEIKGNVAANGVRGLLFSKSTVAKLKTADYLLLGWKIARGLLMLRNRKRR